MIVGPTEVWVKCSFHITKGDLLNFSSWSDLKPEALSGNQPYSYSHFYCMVSFLALFFSLGPINLSQTKKHEQLYLAFLIVLVYSY